MNKIGTKCIIDCEIWWITRTRAIRTVKEHASTIQMKHFDCIKQNNPLVESTPHLLSTKEIDTKHIECEMASIFRDRKTPWRDCPTTAAYPYWAPQCTISNCYSLSAGVGTVLADMSLCCVDSKTIFLGTFLAWNTGNTLDWKTSTKLRKL